MKKILLPFSVVCALAFSTHFAGAAGITVWTELDGESGTNLLWSDTGNWAPGTGASNPPGTGDTVVFNSNAGGGTSTTTVDNIVGADTTIANLQYTNINPIVHDTLIPTGVTLTVNGPFLVGFNNQTTVDAMSGGGNFTVNTSGTFAVGGAIETTTFTLADGTNKVTAATVSISESGSSNGRQAVMNLGNGSNIFQATTVNLGTGKGQGRMQFAGSSGGLTIVSSNGTGRVANMLLGSGTSGSGAANGTLLLTGHPVSILVSNLTMGVLRDTGSQTALISLDQGTLDASSIVMGTTGLAETSGVNSTINLGGVGSNATLIVSAPTFGSTGNGSFIIANSTLGTGAINGTLNLNSGAIAQIYCSITQSQVANNNGTVNLNGGSLTMELPTATIGTPAIPINNVILGSGTLQLAVGGGVPEVVAANLTINGAVTVNIGSLPIIASYPAIFPLIKFTSTINGDPTLVTLGSLPAGTPPFTGYVTNDTANSSIDLVVTSGFIPIGVDIWTGVTNNNWDLVTGNWSLFGSPVLYQNGVNTQFDDTGTATNINLTSALIPASLNISNILKSYTFGGPGSIGGATSLIKNGSGGLTFTNSGSNSFAGGIVINAGSVQFGVGGTGGSFPNNGAAVTDNGTLVLNHSDNLPLSGAISGTGSVVQAGPGVVSLTASNNYSGQTLVTNGTLLVDGYVGGLPASVLTNAIGTTIGGVGTNLGTFNAGGNVSPGDINGIGTLTAANGLTLFPGASATFDLKPTDPTVGGGINDLLAITGDLTLNNNTLNVKIQGLPQQTTYGVITYSGSLNGAFNPVVGGTHYAATIDTNSQPGQINVLITGSTGANLKWASTSSGVWDTGTTANWLNLTNASTDVFDSGDAVVFDDSVTGVQTNITIAAGTFIYPAAITNVSSANNYTIGGAGTISGTGSLVKDGTSTLTVNTTNSFSGGVSILNGTLKAGSGTALGSGTTTIASGATFDINGQNLGSEQFIASGTGVGGNGAIVNSGGAQTSALKNVTLTTDTVFGGTGRWDIRGGSATLNTQGTPCNITKVGTNQVSLVACTCNDLNLENVNILQGIFAIQTSSTQFGDPNGIITVSGGAVLDLWALPAGLAKVVVLQNGGAIYSESGSTTMTGTLTLNTGTGILTNNTATTLIVSSVIGGSGNLLKNGPAITQLGSANTYTGTTTVGAGTLALINSGTLSTNTITIGAGATLDVSAAASPLTLVAGQTLQGGGTNNGNLIAPAGSIVAPGTATNLGTLTVIGSADLEGTTKFKLSKTGSVASSDAINAASGITLNGTLSLSVLSGTLSGGETFQLFTNGAVSGTFTLSPATPGPGLVWNSANLLANGTLSVVATALPKLTLVAGATPGTLTLSSSQAGTLYSAPAVTGPYTVVGPINGSLTINISTSTPAVFYRVTVP